MYIYIYIYMYIYIYNNNIYIYIYIYIYICANSISNFCRYNIIKYNHDNLHKMCLKHI